MDESVFDEPIRRRGISLVGFVVESVTLDEESEKKSVPVQETPVQNEPVQNNNIQEGSWECPNCKKQVNGNFCPECGTKRVEQVFCSNCEKKVEKGAKFCPECGNQM